MRNDKKDIIKYPEKWEHLKTAPRFLINSAPFDVLVLLDSDQKKINHGTLQIHPNRDKKEIEIKHLGSSLVKADDFEKISTWLETSTSKKNQPSIHFSNQLDNNILKLECKNMELFQTVLFLLSLPNAESGRYHLRETFELRSLPDFLPQKISNFSLSSSFSISLLLTPNDNLIQLPFDPHIFHSYGSKEPLHPNLDIYMEKFLKQNQVFYRMINRCEFRIESLSQFLTLSDSLNTL